MSILKTVAKGVSRSALSFATGIFIGTQVTPRLAALTLDCIDENDPKWEKAIKTAGFIAVNAAVVLAFSYVNVKLTDAIFGD